jgi:hypothetical protein
MSNKNTIMPSTPQPQPPTRRYTFIPHKFFLYWLPKYRRQVSERLGRFIKKRTYHVHVVSFCQRLIQNENHLPPGWNQTLDSLRRIGLTDAGTVSTFLKYHKSWEHEQQLPALREKYLQAMDELKSVQRIPDPTPRPPRRKKNKYHQYYVEDDDDQPSKAELLQKAQKRVEYYFDKITSLPIYPTDLQFSKTRYIQMQKVVDHAMPQIVAAFTQHVRERIMSSEEKDSSKQETVVAAVNEGTTTSSSLLPSNNPEEVQNIAHCISRSLKKKKWKDLVMQQLVNFTNTKEDKKVYMDTVAQMYRLIRHNLQDFSGTLEILRTVGLAKRQVGNHYFATLRNKERFAQVKEQIRQLESNVKKIQHEHALARQELTEQTKQLEIFRAENMNSSAKKNDKSKLDLQAKIFQDKIAAAKSQIHERNMAIGYIYQNKLSLLRNLKKELKPPLSEEEFQAIENALDEVMPGIVDKFVVNLKERLVQANDKHQAATEKKGIINAS